MTDRIPKAIRIIGMLMLAGLPSSISAEALRDFCPDRPGLGTPACTIDTGRFAVELGLGDWTLEREAGGRSDTIVTGDLLLRYGVSDALEAQIGWTAFGFARERDRGGSVRRDNGTGDVRIALRRNLRNPDGSGFAAAVMPFITLPVGGAAIGEKTMTAGIVLPASYEFAKGMQVAFSGQIDAAADADGDGHHLAYGAVLGADAPIGRSVSATIEVAARRDGEEGQGRTGLQTGFSLAWLIGQSLQADAGAIIGVNRHAPDLRLYLGIARRF
ncbi:transporter [Sphingosinicella rhizophila]|uniref:Transporter n=1 Tax=Sphingosinicella rhizophila TaxID=3050082 RepID=A0ABU3QB56_9SPHN|nr:transporter [Sphingosinicella sp. GR2756]MDT9600622.1 transporter [Sphingosinicella sp. GR2756]